MNTLDQFRHDKDTFFRASPNSPLTPEQKGEFQGLRYFPENPDLDLAVEVEPFPEGETVLIQTNTGDVRT